MLLDVEGSWLQVELDAEHLEFTIREDQIPAQANGIGDQLDNICREQHCRVAE